MIGTRAESPETDGPRVLPQRQTASARLVTEMDPEFVSLLTLTVVPGTPTAKLEARGGFELPAPRPGADPGGGRRRAFG